LLFGAGFREIVKICPLEFLERRRAVAAGEELLKRV